MVSTQNGFLNQAVTTDETNKSCEADAISLAEILSSGLMQLCLLKTSVPTGQADGVLDHRTCCSKIVLSLEADAVFGIIAQLHFLNVLVPDCLLCLIPLSAAPHD